MVVNAAAALVQIDTLTIGFVCDHQRAGHERVRFCLVVPGEVFLLKSDSIALTTQGAAVTGDFLCWTSLGHVWTRFVTPRGGVPPPC